jgi:hypothetical protein
MVITHITIPRDKDTGETLRFTCELRHIVTVNTDTVEMQNTSELNGKAVGAKKQATTEAKKGVQSSETASAAKQSSIAKTLENLLLKFAKG